MRVSPGEPGEEIGLYYRRYGASVTLQRHYLNFYPHQVKKNEGQEMDLSITFHEKATGKIPILVLKSFSVSTTHRNLTSLYQKFNFIAISRWFERQKAEGPPTLKLRRVNSKIKALVSCLHYSLTLTFQFFPESVLNKTVSVSIRKNSAKSRAHRE